MMRCHSSWNPKPQSIRTQNSFKMSGGVDDNTSVMWLLIAYGRNASVSCVYQGRPKHVSELVNAPSDHILNYITACSRVLFENLRFPQLDKKFPEFYGTLKFNTALERAKHLSLS